MVSKRLQIFSLRNILDLSLVLAIVISQVVMGLHPCRSCTLGQIEVNKQMNGTCYFLKLNLLEWIILERLLLMLYRKDADDENETGVSTGLLVHMRASGYCWKTTVA